MTTIANCKCCGSAASLCDDFEKEYFYVCNGSNCGVTGPIRGSGIEAIAAWNALMSPDKPKPKPEPAPGTVRARMAVVNICNSGRLEIHWQMEPGGKQYNAESPGDQFRPIIAYITADIPLPQPPEIEGSVE